MVVFRIRWTTSRTYAVYEVIVWSQISRTYLPLSAKEILKQTARLIVFYVFLIIYVQFYRATQPKE